jgi:cell wall-associated NlpC family hydrolase
MNDPLELLVGVPFKVGGRDISGMDCLGLVLAGCQLLGRPFPDPWKRYAEVWQRGERPIEELTPAGWSQLLPAVHLLRGDIILSRSDGVPNHVSLAVGARDLLHTTKEGQRSEIIRARMLRPRMVYVYRCGAA